MSAEPLAHNVVPLFGALSAQTRDTTAMPPLDYRPDPDAELVSEILIRMERPLAVIVVSRACDDVWVAINDEAARLTPRQAMAAAHCLFTEQAFAGCGEVAAQLMETAIEIDPSVARGHRFTPRRPGRAERIHAGRTGFASTLGLAALIVAAYALAGLSPFLHGVG